MSQRYFVNTGDGVDFYDSREKAIAAAQNAIDGWRDCCDPEWPEEVESVCWGPIAGESIPQHRGAEGEYLEYELSIPVIEWRCNLCGGLVLFDGTKPGVAQ